MATTTEKVVFDFKTITKGFQRGLNKMNMGMVNLRKNVTGFGQAMALPLQSFKQGGKGMENMTNRGMQMGVAFRKLTHGAKGFRMEMLGIMFFGMAINRVLKGLIRTSLEWVGVTEILNVALGILFLPLAMMLLEWALKFLGLVDSLSEGQKKWIGNFVLLGIVFGTLLTVIGALALGMGSLILVFGQLFGAGGMLAGIIPVLSSILVGLSATFVAVASVVLLIIAGIALAWKDNFLNMRGVVSDFIAGVKLIFFGLIDIVKGLFFIIKGIFTGDFDLILEGLKITFMGIGNVIFGFFKSIYAAIKAIIIGMLKLFKDFVVKTNNLFEFIFPKWMVNLFKLGFNVGGGKNKTLGFAKGGVVPGPIGQPVPAVVHGGETITPVGGGNINAVSPQININVDKISSDYDVRRLAEELKRYWVTDFESSAQRRGR